ncbi:hypothetical protein OIU78_014484 [Salix suchowensis]|nr:hypothetical protein OIU78_014484 [Salix suchowensis]
MICYFFYKNIAFGLTLFYFEAFTAFSGQSIYNDWYMLLFNVILTSLPVISLGVFEQDVSSEVCLQFPALYQQGTKNLFFDWYRILGWMGNDGAHDEPLYMDTTSLSSGEASPPGDVYKLLAEALGPAPIYWTTILLVTVACILPYLVHISFQRCFNPMDHHIIQEIKYYKKDVEDQHMWRRERSKARQETKIGFTARVDAKIRQLKGKLQKKSSTSVSRKLYAFPVVM